MTEARRTPAPRDGFRERRPRARSDDSGQADGCCHGCVRGGSAEAAGIPERTGATWTGAQHTLKPMVSSGTERCSHRRGVGDTLGGWAQERRSPTRWPRWAPSGAVLRPSGRHGDLPQSPGSRASTTSRAAGAARGNGVAGHEDAARRLGRHARAGDQRELWASRSPDPPGRPQRRAEGPDTAGLLPHRQETGSCPEAAGNLVCVQTARVARDPPARAPGTQSHYPEQGLPHGVGFPPWQAPVPQAASRENTRNVGFHPRAGRERARRP